MTYLRRLYLEPELVVSLAALVFALGGCGTGATNTTPGVGGNMGSAGTAGSGTGGGGNASGTGGGGVAGSAAGSAGSAGGAAGVTGSAGQATGGSSGGSAGGSGGATGGGGGGGGVSGSGGSGGGTAGGGGNAGRGGGTAGGGGNAGRGGGGGGTAGGAGGTAGGAGGTGGVDPNFTNWPTGSSPQEIGRRLVMNYLDRTLSLTAEMHYAEVGTWYGALTTTKLIPEATLDANLIARFAPLLTTAGADAIPSRAHVDDRIFGIVPLEIYLHNTSQPHLTFGKKFADDQWMTTTADGITTEARYWVDDMYMIPSLQVQTYRATKDTKYLDRAAITAAAYITRLQQPNGLFFHTTTSPRFWGRGNGWFAAGFSELLRELPTNHPQRAAVMAGYTKMMAGLLQYQAASGMWNQLSTTRARRTGPSHRRPRCSRSRS